LWGWQSGGNERAGSMSGFDEPVAKQLLIGGHDRIATHAELRCQSPARGKLQPLAQPAIDDRRAKCRMNAARLCSDRVVQLDRQLARAASGFLCPSQGAQGGPLPTTPPPRDAGLLLVNPNPSSEWPALLQKWSVRLCSKWTSRQPHSR